MMTQSSEKKQNERCERLNFFRFLEKDEPRPERKLQVKLPVLDFIINIEFLKRYQAQYNHQKNILRKKRKLGDPSVAGLPNKEFQRILSGHFALIEALIKLASVQMKNDCKQLAGDGAAAINPNAPYSVRTNNKVLMQMMRTLSTGTIWERMERLKECGFIVGKKWHGTQQNYEVLLNPDFLLIFDASDMKYRPSSTLLEKTVECGLPLHFYQNLIPLHHLKDKGSNPIKSERNSASLHGHETGKAGIEPLEKEPKGCDPAMELTVKSSEAPGCDDKHPDQEKDPNRGAGGRWEQKQRMDAMDLPTYKAYLVHQFLLAAIKLLWPKREIYDGAFDNIKKYILRHYFLCLNTREAVDDRISGMYQIAQMHSDWIAKDPSRRFALLPAQYFDLKRKLRKVYKPDKKKYEVEDYSGYLGGVRLIKNRKLRQQFRDLERKRYELDRLYHRWLKDFEKDPSTFRRLALIRKVSERYPEKLDELKQYLVRQQLKISA